MEKQKLKSILNEALQEFITRDMYLLECNAHEQAISSKLACYLYLRIPFIENEGWHVDVEYNRNGETPKELPSGGYFRPDIIIHRRGKNNPNRIEDNNLLVIEIKKNSIDEKYDIYKIKTLINSYPYYCTLVLLSI
jgi:hypothetical protein